ncbi:MAG: hypothetical protein ACI87O_002751 [Planctomycetota bacterium]|jgi:hypothetical protein
MAIWKNLGNGRFLDETDFLIIHPGNVVTAIAVRDLDAEGDIDLVTGPSEATGGIADRIWINDGGGVFTPWIDLPLILTNTSGLAITDFNGDGLVDLLMLKDEWGHSIQWALDRLSLGMSSGRFALDIAFSSAAWNETLAASTFARSSEVDLDGDVDPFVTRYDSGGNGGSPGASNVLLIYDGLGHFTIESPRRPGPRRRKDNAADSAFERRYGSHPQPLYSDGLCPSRVISSDVCDG